jgi:hypothetical protein
VHNTQQLQCGHSLEKFPRILMQAKDILERLMDALSCIDQCFIADGMLEELPTPSSVGKTKVGGIDLNKASMRWVVEALIALCVSPSAQGFTASELGRQVIIGGGAAGKDAAFLAARAGLNMGLMRELDAAAQDAAKRTRR